MLSAALKCVRMDMKTKFYIISYMQNAVQAIFDKSFYFPRGVIWRRAEKSPQMIYGSFPVPPFQIHF